MTSTFMGRCFFSIGAFFATNLIQHVGSNHSHKRRSSHHHHHHHVTKEEDATPPSLSGLHITNRTDAALADWVQDLPGLNYKPGFDQFAGYLDVSDTKHVFYWYVESQSDPNNDPLVLWTNGGPGCSGLIGFGTEHGPYFISANGTLDKNPYSWNTFANMLYIEQPAGVGFSYTDTHHDIRTGDIQAAADNYQLINEFLTRFPERASNRFYISSESYGGHYMPQLALEILDRDTDGRINFAGMLVGNPYVDPFSNAITQFEAYYSHGLLAKPLWDNFIRHCNDPESFVTSQCEDLGEELFQEFDVGINPYALDYPVCIEEGSQSFDTNHVLPVTSQERQRNLRHTQRRLQEEETLDGSGRRLKQTNTVEGPLTTSSSQVNALMNRTRRAGPPFLPQEDRFRPCGEKHLEDFLNHPDVRQALHVDPTVRHWKSCGGVDYSEMDIDTPTTPLFQELVSRGVRGEHSLHLMVVSGDDDSICSTSGTQYWIWSLGVNATAAKLWKAWKVKEQTAGFVTSFELGNETKAQLTFATVHGAGHEVPAYRPMEALELFGRYLSGKW